MIQLTQQLAGASNFEQALALLGNMLCALCQPAPLRLTAVERGSGAVRLACSVPLADQRPFRTLASASLSRFWADGGGGRLIRVSSPDARLMTAATALSAHTVECLTERNTRWVLVHDLAAGRGERPAGFLAWEFDEEPSGWEELAGTATVLGPWLNRTPPAPVGAVSVRDTALPVAGPRMREVLDLLIRFIDLDEPLLLTGETGVGKTRLAKWAHSQSRRRGGPFVRVNLSTTPSDLQASRLFGYRRGAFTGADRDTKGVVAEALGGTLFIDEVGKLPPQSQTLLLDLLDSGHFTPLGAVDEERADVRIICGAGVGLGQQVGQGKFLTDLYHRLAVFPVQLPPLRERRSDIAGWATHFACARAAGAGSARCTLTAHAEELLSTQPWPGNLRQLDAVIKRAYALAGGGRVAVLEAQHIQRALEMEPVVGEAHGDRVQLWRRLEAAARRLVELAQRRPQEPWLKVMAGFSGIVLAEAMDRVGKREAYMLLGEGHRLHGDNHHKHARQKMAERDELKALINST